MLKPFTVHTDDKQLVDLKTRLAMSRFPEKETVNDWSQGVPLAYIREVSDYWQHAYDMGRLARRLNALPQFTAAINGLDIHFIHARSPEFGARPLLLTHGWPGSVVEFLKVIAPPLTNPIEHNGDPTDASHVICPSLPGYGFSSKPGAIGCGVDKIAQTWSQLMVALGYDSYYAQGGDWGSPITARLAHRDNRCKGIHLKGASKNEDFFVRARKHRAQNRSLHVVNEDSSTELTQLSRKKTIFRGALNMPIAFPSEEQRQSLTAEEQGYLARMEHFRTAARGGHFAAFEQPEIFVDELRCCFRQLEN